MISNKALATLFLITLNMQLVASTSRSIKKRKPSGEPTPRIKKRGPARKPREVLQDMTSNIHPVEVQKESTGVISTSQEPSASHVNSQFKTLIEKGEYEEIFEIGKKMSDEELLRQLCPVIETPDQYKRIVDYLKGRKLVASFYVHGNIEVVKRAIIESGVYDWRDYFKDGDLEIALSLVLKEDRHDSVIKLLDVRKGITAAVDEQSKLEGRGTSFEWFVYYFLKHFVPWNGGIALRRFLIFRGEELRNKYPDILDTLCQELIYKLNAQLRLQNAREFLVDLIGQPSLLKPVIFARGFLSCDNDERRSAFIKYGWRETIQEGLKTGYYGGGWKLWRVIQEEQPAQFPGQFPDNEEARIAACMHLPTKQEKEELWADANAKMFYAKIKSHDPISHLLPDVLWPIVFGYVISRPDTDDPAIPK